MTAILGTGRAFILIPAKVYLLRMRTNLAIAIRLFSGLIVTPSDIHCLSAGAEG